MYQISDDLFLYLYLNFFTFSLMNPVETLQVDLGERSYPITFPKNAMWLIAMLEEITRTQAYSKIAVIADKAIDVSALASFCVYSFNENGETLKSMAYLEKLYDWFAEQGLDRKSVIVAIGGGVVGDLVGFAASSWLRGVDFIQVPTTLLSMVDSSVGGKTGINIKAGKNLVGAFYQPQAVYIHTGFLKTLQPREFSAGMAEVIKYGMLADKALFEQLESLDTLHAEHPELPKIIRRCCELKAEVVRADEKEQAATGGRALLNLGHTFAHAVENVAGYGQYLHGEAVGVGLVLAAELSVKLGKLAASDVQRVCSLCERYGLPVRLQEPLPLDELMGAMQKDKKNRSGKLRFVAMESLGEAITVDDVSVEWIHELWLNYGATRT